MRKQSTCRPWRRDGVALLNPRFRRALSNRASVAVRKLPLNVSALKGWFGSAAELDSSMGGVRRYPATGFGVWGITGDRSNRARSSAKWAALSRQLITRIDAHVPQVASVGLPPRMTEDPATGSATAATAALIAHVRGWQELSLCVAQGVDMGRPSILFARVDLHGGHTRIRVGGKCVSVMEGSFQLEGDE